MEDWRPVPGYPLYLVSDKGNVKTLLSNKLLKMDQNKQGYFRVKLSLGKRFSIHQLVMLAFIGQLPEKHEINHKNGIPSDNSLKNLEYVTKSYNQWHCNHVIKTRKSQKGSRHGRSKLTEKMVTRIRRIYSSGKTMHEIAVKFNVCPGTICMIVNRKIWRHC